MHVVLMYTRSRTTYLLRRTDLKHVRQAWRASDCMRGLDWSAVRCLSSTGEASAAEDYHWLSARAGYKPVIEYCGGARPARLADALWGDPSRG